MPPNNNMMRKIILSIFLPLIAFHSQAQHYKVSSLSELQSAINNAKKGDTILLASGKYKNGGIVSFTKDDITVMAERSGSVILTGNTAFKITASHSTLSGMQFIDGEVDGEKGKVVEVLGNYNQITQCNFSNVTSHNYIHIEADAHDNVISYCNLERKPAVHNAGPGIQINTSENTVSRTLITHCSFLDFDGEGGDFGNEPIRIGLGKEPNSHLPYLSSPTLHL